MSRIRSKGTRPEEALADIVEVALGQACAVNRNDRQLPGAPDIVVPSLRLCIFADGCFFHMCPVHYRPPRTRPEYWVPKIERNARRDRRHARQLRREGWAVWRLWEHDLRPAARSRTELKLARRLENRKITVIDLQREF
jgi:DNA mismatch endonuclease, patch repair protein